MRGLPTVVGRKGKVQKFSGEYKDRCKRHEGSTQESENKSAQGPMEGDQKELERPNGVHNGARVPDVEGSCSNGPERQ